MPKELSEVNLAEIVLDWNLYPRTEVSQETVGRLREAINSRAKIPAIIIDEKTMKIIDGFHRYRAYQRLKIDTIFVEKRKYLDEQEMIKDAGLLNSNHGRPFSSQDCRRFILLASAAGLSKGKIADILHVTRDKIDVWSAQRAIYKNAAVPIKRGLTQFIGKKLTEGQRKLNREWGGMNATFYINQLILYVQADAVIPDDLNFIEKMDRLVEAWEKAKEKLK